MLLVLLNFNIKIRIFYFVVFVWNSVLPKYQKQTSSNTQTWPKWKKLKIGILRIRRWCPSQWSWAHLLVPPAQSFDWCVQGACSRGETRPKCTSVAPSPPRGKDGEVLHRNPLTLISRDLGGYMESGSLRLHSHSKQHVHCCSTNQDSSREKF